MDPGLNFDEKLEKVSLTACKKCYHILVRKPNIYALTKSSHFERAEKDIVGFWDGSEYLPGLSVLGTYTFLYKSLHFSDAFSHFCKTKLFAICPSVSKHYLITIH